eukprot:TRINITY_DN9862_c0_g1_i2.p1 TRINITY_DN9862_c0_g1~~TRINITY_DN9862_c0_g1_i2.p1  ORF type:complete len:410 (-),score=45.12 TRINITY_DN9862_c0_g1_i2:1748-2977(-)
MSFLSIPVILQISISQFAAKTLFGQPANIAHMAAEFCQYSLPGALCLMFGTTILKMLQTQNRMMPPALISAIVFVLDIPLQIVFVQRMGLNGSSLALSIVRFVWVLMLLGYWILVQFKWWKSDDDNGDQHVSSTAVKIFNKQIIYAGVKKGINITNIYRFVRLGVAGGFMLLTEALSFEITTAFAARLGTDELDAHVSMLTTGAISYTTFPLSFAVVATILVGNNLGAQQHQKAKRLGYLCVLFASVSMFVCGLLFLIFRYNLSTLYTDDQNIIRLIQLIILPLAAFQLFDGLQGSQQGVLRGMGRQLQLFLFNMMGFWGCGVVVGAITCYGFGWGLQGIWWGLTFGVFVTSMLTLFTLGRVDWEEEMLKVRKSQTSQIQPTQSDKLSASDIDKSDNNEQMDIELVPLV